MNIVLMLAHSIEEYDQVRLLAGLGHRVFSIGAYIDPAHPLDDKRPALDVPCQTELKAVVDAIEPTPDNADRLDIAKRHLPDEVIDWADIIICHHLEHQWLLPQWERIRHKRVVWRTVGQSSHGNEYLMQPLRRDGLQIVRYSPRERNLPEFAGEDALVRFYKDPAEWDGWTGEALVVTNITQELARRDPYTNFRFWAVATRNLLAMPAGPGSERIGGIGAMDYEAMRLWLRRARCYLYTGTQPASYTLGLIEAMMTGVPVVSIGPSHHNLLPYGPSLFEGHEIAGTGKWSDSPTEAGAQLHRLLADVDHAQLVSQMQRHTAIELFGRDKIAAQWDDFLTGREVGATVADEVMVA